MTKKSQPTRLSIKTFWVLVALLLLPITINTLHQIYTDRFNQSLFLIELAITVAALLLLVYPAAKVLGEIHSREEQSRKTRQNVAELMDHAADLILISTPSGKIVHANKKACEVLGYSLQQLLTMSTMDIDSECVMYRTPGYHHKLYMGQSVNFDTWFKSRTGERIPVENHLSVAGWMDKTHYLEIARDITRRRQIEEELNASKEALEMARNRLESRMNERNQKLHMEVQKRELTEKRIFEIRLLLENLVNSMPSVIIALDTNRKITQWNLEAEKVFNLLQASVLGKHLIDVMPQHRTAIFKLMRRSANGKKRIIQNIEFELEDGLRQFNVMVYPLSESIGHEDPGVVIRLDDITEKSRFDEMLVQTEKMLSLGGLAAGMAHEINNPLGAILQSTQNILRRLDPEFARNRQVAQMLSSDIAVVNQYVQEQKIDSALMAIKEAGERAANIVSEMLSFARPSRAATETVDIVEAIESTIRLAAKDYNRQRQFDFRDIKIVKIFADNLPKIPVARSQFQQVLLNLLVNAAQAMAEQVLDRKPSIHISAGLEGQFCRIDVVDNGPGMDRNTKKRVFEPFFSTKSEGKGTGLGLSVSYFIVTEQLGGLLSVDSQPGVGSRFTILLPIPNPESEPLGPEYSPQQEQLPLDHL